jgi:hypothetical protein
MVSAQKLTESIRNQFTLIQRLIYAVKKYWFLVGLLTLSIYALTRIDPALELLTMLIESIARICVGVFMAEAFWKFRMPKIGLQSQIGEGNIAAAIIFLAFLLAAVSA